MKSKTHAPHPKHDDRVLCGIRRADRMLVVVANGENPTCKHCDEIIRDAHEDLLN